MTSSTTYSLQQAPLGEIVAKHGMEVTYLFIEDPKLSLTDMALIDDHKIFEDDNRGFDEFVKLVQAKQISFYIPNSVGDEELAKLEPYRKGFLPWNDTDIVDYAIMEKGDLILKRHAQ